MVQLSWLKEPLSQEDADTLTFLTLKDDTEDAPWMVMGPLQFWSATGLAHSLKVYAQTIGLPWFVGSMQPILYTWRGEPEKRQLAPDLFVAFGLPDDDAPSFDADVKGFPPFVLEVISPSSATRDRGEKREAYRAMGVKEYALFTPLSEGTSILEGYRRDAEGQFIPWPRDEQGRLWSDELGLYLLVGNELVRAQTRDGRLLPTPGESEAGRLEAEAELQRAETARQQAEAARQRAEDRARISADEAQQARAEADRLREELRRLREE